MGTPACQTGEAVSAPLSQIGCSAAHSQHHLVHHTHSNISSPESLMHHPLTQSTSVADVCAFTRGVSRKRSATVAAEGFKAKVLSERQHTIRGMDTCPPHSPRTGALSMRNRLRAIAQSMSTYTYALLKNTCMRKHALKTHVSTHARACTHTHT